MLIAFSFTTIYVIRFCLFVWQLYIVVVLGPVWPQCPLVTVCVCLFVYWSCFCFGSICMCICACICNSTNVYLPVCVFACVCYFVFLNVCVSVCLWYYWGYECVYIFSLSIHAPFVNFLCLFIKHGINTLYKNL